MANRRFLTACAAVIATIAMTSGSADAREVPGWEIQNVPLPQNAQLASLGSVSCPKVNDCIALGGSGSDPRGAFAPLAERWDGHAWKVMASPPISLGSLSCLKPNDCIAVGGNLAAHWDGSVWTVQPTPDLSKTSWRFGLASVSCPNTDFCMAVGGQQPKTDLTIDSLNLAESWNGSSWVVQPTPTPDAFHILGCELEVFCYSSLQSVACLSPNDCNAVGTYYNGDHVHPFAEHWDAYVWTIQPTQEPPAYSGYYPLGSWLSGVSCSTSNDCTAVGSYNNETPDGMSTVDGTLIEHWDGSDWRIQASPPFPRFSNAALTSVSCPKPNDCTAVGSYLYGYPDSPSTAALVEHWNGSTWAIQATPNVVGHSGLSAVSCAKKAHCEAVGSSIVYDVVPKEFPLVEGYSK
jgi:hypothetical protein